MLDRSQGKDRPIDAVPVTAGDGGIEALEQGAVTFEKCFRGVELPGKLRGKVARCLASDGGQGHRHGGACLDEHGTTGANQGLEQHSCRTRFPLVGNAVNQRRERRLGGTQLSKAHCHRDVPTGELHAVVRRPPLREDAQAQRHGEGDNRDRERHEHASRNRRTRLEVGLLGSRCRQGKEEAIAQTDKRASAQRRRLRTAVGAAQVPLARGIAVALSGHLAVARAARREGVVDAGLARSVRKGLAQVAVLVELALASARTGASAVLDVRNIVVGSTGVTALAALDAFLGRFGLALRVAGRAAAAASAGATRAPAARATRAPAGAGTTRAPAAGATGTAARAPAVIPAASFIDRTAGAATSTGAPSAGVDGTTT